MHGRGDAQARAVLFTAWTLVGVVATTGAAAQTQEQIDWCENKNRQFSPDLQINGCTAVIQSGQWSGKNLAWAFNNRGNAYSDSKDYARAIAEFTSAIQLDPTHPSAFYNRGNMYYDQGDNDLAIADYNQAIQLDPNHAKAYANRALAYENKGNREQAIADFRRAAALGDAGSYDDLRRLGATP